MLRVRSLRRVATGESNSLPAVESLPIAQSQSPKPRIPVAPIVLFFLCGLVAARVFPDSSLISGEAGRGPGLVLPQLQQPEVSLPGATESPSAANLTGLGLRCQSWCLTRDIYVTREDMAHCQQQCTAHPEVMDWIPALEASAAAPAGVNDRQLIFAAWYAEGERGSEVGRSATALVLSPAATAESGLPTANACACIVECAKRGVMSIKEVYIALQCAALHTCTHAVHLLQHMLLHSMHCAQGVFPFGSSLQLIQQNPASSGISFVSTCVDACSVSFAPL